jgi:hypothetical protein
MVLRGLSALLAAFVLGLTASPSASAAPSSRLVYARGPGAERCPDEGAFRRAVEARVGYDPFFPWAPLTVSVEVKAESGSLSARIVVVGRDGFEHGAQTIVSQDGDCSELVASVGLAVSVALDSLPEVPREDSAPAAVNKTDIEKTDTVESSALPSLPVPQPPPGPPVQEAPRPATPAAREAASLWAAAGIRGSYGTWTAATVAPDLLVELRWRALGLALQGRYDLPATVGLSTGVKATVDRPSGAILPCLHLGSWLGCGIAMAGIQRAWGDVASSQTATAAFLAFGGRLGFDTPLFARVHLLATADIVGIATPFTVAVDLQGGGQATVASAPVEASGGIALAMPIL